MTSTDPARPEDDDAFAAYQRTLALVDEIIGLRAALAQEAIRASPSKHRLEELEAEAYALRHSTTWRLAKILLLPATVAKRILVRFRLI